MDGEEQRQDRAAVASAAPAPSVPQVVDLADTSSSEGRFAFAAAAAVSEKADVRMSSRSAHLSLYLSRVPAASHARMTRFALTDRISSRSQVVVRAAGPRPPARLGHVRKRKMLNGKRERDCAFYCTLYCTVLRLRPEQ